MATTGLIPVYEYLNKTYRPDCDYIDGELKERNLGERPHATVQGLFAAIFFTNRKQWNIRALPEQRVQTSEIHYRIADLCILWASDPPDPIVHKAPLVCIKILSRDQTLTDLQECVDDYLGMGVDNIWIFDPLSRRAWLGKSNGFQKWEGDAFFVPGTPIRIPLADIYAELDGLDASR